MCRKIILTIIGLFFSIFLLIEWIGLITLTVLLPQSTCIYKQSVRKLGYLKDFLCKKSLTRLVQLILDSSISLSCALWIIGYHQFLFSFLKLVTKYTHKFFLGKLFQETIQLTQSSQAMYYINIILPYLFLFAGYFGLTMQISLVLDFMYLFNLPTILVYKLLTRIYTCILFFISYLKIRISSNPKKWLTQTLNPIYTLESIKFGGILTIILLVYGLIFTTFYYIWLALVIVVLRTLMNVVDNIRNIFQFGGDILVKLKSLRRRQGLTWKQILIQCYDSSEQTISFQTIAEIFKGQDIMVNILQKRINKISDQQLQFISRQNPSILEIRSISIVSQLIRTFIQIFSDDSISIQ